MTPSREQAILQSRIKELGLKSAKLAQYQDELGAMQQEWLKLGQKEELLQKQKQESFQVGVVVHKLQSLGHSRRYRG